MSYGFEIRDASNNILVNNSSYGFSLIDIILIDQIQPDGNVYMGSKTFPEAAYVKFALTQTMVEPTTNNFSSINQLTAAKLSVSVSGYDKIISWSPFFSFGGTSQIPVNVYVMAIGTISNPQNFEFNTTQSPYSYENLNGFFNDSARFFTTADGYIQKSSYYQASITAGTWFTPNILDSGDLFEIQYNITQWTDNGSPSAIYINAIPRNAAVRTFTTQWYDLSSIGNKFDVLCDSPSGGWDTLIQGSVTIRHKVTGTTITSPLYFNSSGSAD